MASSVNSVLTMSQAVLVYLFRALNIMFQLRTHDQVFKGGTQTRIKQYIVYRYNYYLCHHLLLLYIHDWNPLVYSIIIIYIVQSFTYIHIYWHHVPAVSVGQSSCYNDGKFYAAGKCMSIHTMNNEEKSWFHARHRCNLISGRLLEVDNSEIMNFMRDDLRDNKDINGHIRYWIGASRITTTWQNGSCIIVLRNPAPNITYIHVYVYDCCL